MSDKKNRMYEGLFLFPQNAIADMQSASDHVMALLARADAEVVSFKKWDDRRLAYEIKGNKRGVYFQAFFRCEPTRLEDLERNCNLSEQLLRSLVIRADHMNAEDIEAAEGRSALADEIKVRSEQATQVAEGGDGSATVTIGAKTDEAAEAAPAATAAPAAPEAEKAETPPAEEPPAKG